MDDAVLDRPEFMPERTTRTFRISATTTTAMVVLPALMRRLHERAPGVVLHIVASVTHGEKLLELPGVDLALLAAAVPSELKRERLYQDRWMAAVAPGNRAVTEAVTLDHLTELPHVKFDTGVLHQQLVPYQVLDGLGIHYTVRLQVTDFLLVPLLLRHSDMIAVVQERPARALARAGVIRLFPMPVTMPPLGIDMVWNPRRAQDPGALWLREELVAVAAGDEDHAAGE